MWLCEEVSYVAILTRSQLECFIFKNGMDFGWVKCTYILILSSETYDQDVELFLPKKAILTGILLLILRGHLINGLPKAVSFQVTIIKLLTLVAWFLWP